MKRASACGRRPPSASFTATSARARVARASCASVPLDSAMRTASSTESRSVSADAEAARKRRRTAFEQCTARCVLCKSFAEYGGRDSRKRKNAVDAAECDGFFGHAEDDAGRFILRNRMAAGGGHFEKPLRAVVAHAGEDDADRVRAGGLRDRLEEHVDARTMSRNERSVAELDVMTRAAAPQNHMLIAGRDEDAAPSHGVAAHGFFHFDARE